MYFTVSPFAPVYKADHKSLNFMCINTADPTKSDMQLRDIISSLQKAENDWKAQLKALRTAETLIRAHPDELEHWAVPVMKALLYTTVPKWSDEEGKPGEGSFEKQRFM